MRRTLALVVATLAIGAVLVAPAVPAEEPGEAPTEMANPAPDQLVAPDATGSQLWPYTSRSRSVDGRTLAVNVVIVGPPATVERALADRTGANWTTAEEHQTTPVVDDPSPWTAARGSTRYTYVVPADANGGQWVDASYQLGTGTYLGTRVHIRAYPAPTGNWTAIQAHTEYWDWYRLRHTVTSVPDAARFVEADLQDEPFVIDVDRQHHGRSGGGSRGWMTVVQFAAIGVAASAFVDRGTIRREDVAVPVLVAASVLGVRAAGLLAESIAPGVSPKAFAAVLYPILVAGPPLALSLGRDRPAARTVALATVALAVALVADLAFVGVAHVPDRLLHHRIALVGAFGLLAFGVAERDRLTAAFGVLAWLLVLVAPLAGYV
ncbi:hypothetical protein G9C85_15965 [Halorubellus sp. JP-L1]|uniref:hypothetical protein n=1 Tax=Halorubellus sp. JP-L1 TaxID=2715753 RepID=UPI0014090707|nr:hypothetical protein [Halorubellus sp. JP-L1]NHN43114.1 hypothetical protein [Halorubellus sp. JP-L1]